MDHFGKKAADWDENEKRTNNVRNIANTIREQVQVHSDMHIMDFGSGTGLLLEHVAPSVRKITAVDVSEAMNAQLEKKIDSLPCDVEIAAVDLAATDLQESFDGVISSMTMHHVEDVETMFAKFHAHLNEGGFLAIADLDKEDGTFHTEEDTGVYHLGFERDAFRKMAMDAGFQDVRTSDASVIHHDERAYPVFLLTARK